VRQSCCRSLLTRCERLQVLRTRLIPQVVLVLLASPTASAHRQILVGTWADAHWAVSFYQRHGFELVGDVEKDRLLRKYWSIPQRQIETSVVLVDPAVARIWK